MTKIDMKITHLKCHWNLPGANATTFLMKIIHVTTFNTTCDKAVEMKALWF